MSLVLWLPLNGNLDNQGLTSMPVLSMSNVEWPAGKLCNKCLYIKGTASNTIIVPELNGEKEFSISVWWKVNESDMKTALDFRDFFAVYLNTDGVEGTYRIEHSNNTTYPGMVQSLFPRNGANFSPGYFGYGSHSGNKYQWNHEVVCVNKQTAKWYVNGELTNTINVTDIYKDNMFLTGKLYFGENGSIAQLQDFRIYDHCLSAKEVKEISKGLILHYPLSSPYEESVKNLYSNKFENGYTNCNSEITRSILTDENGISYTNYKFSKSPGITNTWYRIWYDKYAFQAGKTYTISMDIRVNSCSNCVVDLRHARLDNDYFGGKIARIVDSSKVTKDWKPYTLTQVIPASFIYNSETKTCNPLIELYTGNLAVPAGDTTTTRSADFDIRFVQVIEKDHDLPFASGSREDGIFDCSGYGNDGVVDYATCPTWNSDSVKYNGCCQFDGKSFISAGRGAMVTDELTVNCWAYMDDWSQFEAKNMRIASCTEVGGWNFEPGSGYLRFVLGTGTDSNVYKTAISKTLLKSFSSGWHMITGSYNGLATKIYVDAILLGTNSEYTEKVPLYYNTTNGIFIGAEAGGDKTTPFGNYFTGKLSDFRIYATALSDKDIEELYETKFSLDPDGNFYCGELSEQSSSIQFNKKSILSVNEFCEFDSINLSYIDTYEDNPTSLSYTPSTGSNSCLTGYRIHQQSLKAGDIVAIDLDLHWDGFDTSNVDGAFSLRFQGYAIKENDETRYWVSDQYGSALNKFKNLTSLVLSSPSGTFHYSVVVQITLDMLNYIYKMIGLRSDYSNGKGTVSIQNLFARKICFRDDGVNKMKIDKSGDVSCTNLIEI